MQTNDNHVSLRARRWIQTALWAWGILAIALCVKVVVEGHRHSVYPAFDGGSDDWWAGEVMYDHRGYYYSPTFSVLFSPFAILPDLLGQMLWGVTSIGLYVWSLRVFYRDVLPAHWPRETEAGFLLLTLGGSLRGIWSLQSNALLMACILFAAAAIVRNRWWRAAWLLAVPIYIKVWPVIVAALLSVQWPRKLIGRGLAACAVLACVPFLTKAPADVAGYYQSWIECLANRQATAERFTGYRDGWTIWEQFQSPVNSRAYFAVQAAGGLATLAWCLWLQRRRVQAPKGYPGFRKHSPTVPVGGSQSSEVKSRESGVGTAKPPVNGITPSPLHPFTPSPLHREAEIVTYTLAAWTAWQLLLGPGTERLTYLIVAPFASWAILTSNLQRRDLRLAIAAFVTLFVFGAGGVERMLVGWLPAAVALQPMGVVLFLVWLVRHAMSGDSWQADCSATQEENAATRLDAQPSHFAIRMRGCGHRVSSTTLTHGDQGRPKNFPQSAESLISTSAVSETRD